MKWLFTIFAVLFLSMAVFAYQLGLDNNQEWGRGRIILLTGGLASLGAGTIIHFWGAKAASIINKYLSTLNKSFSRTNQITIASILAAVLTITIYSWVLQLDQRIIRRVEKQDYDYYSELAKSFKGGRLYIADAPPPELLALDNPYDYFLRRQLGIENFPWDVSLYKGKFYLYWGPVPAVLLTAFNLNQLSNIADFHLAFVFACGVFLYMALLIRSFWKNSIRYSPAWLLTFLLFVVGLSTPVTIILKGAMVYEAAIFGSQFFFIGGFYWLYSALRDDKPVIWKLALATAHWALAVGTRIIILPSVLFCVGFTLVYAIRCYSYTKIKASISILAALLLPLILAGIGLAWYNWARFDSIFEFGLTYQLANIDYTKFEGLFSISRISYNTKLYFAYPLKMMPKFPYISRIEYLHSNDRLGGLFYITPYIFLSILPVYHLFKKLFIPKKFFAPGTKYTLAEPWLFFALLGSGSISILILMSYYFVAMRFIEDFMPALLILITIQIGRSHDDLFENKTLKRSLSAIVVALGLITITANLLLAMPGNGIAFMLNFINAISKFMGLK